MRQGRWRGAPTSPSLALWTAVAESSTLGGESGVKRILDEHVGHVGVFSSANRIVFGAVPINCLGQPSYIMRTHPHHAQRPIIPFCSRPSPFYAHIRKKVAPPKHVRCLGDGADLSVLQAKPFLLDQIEKGASYPRIWWKAKWHHPRSPGNWKWLSGQR